jgi:hypothetical protein
MKLTAFPCSAEVRNKWNSTSLPPICLPGVDRDNFTLNWHSLVGYGGSSYHTTRGHILEERILTAHRRERFSFRVVIKSVCLVQLHNSVMAVTSLPQSTDVLFISSAYNPHQRYHIYQQIRKCVLLQSIHNLNVFFLHILICMFISYLQIFYDPFMR